MRVAGFRHHSGWAIAVVVDDDGHTPALVHRSRVELCPAELPRQVYHDVGERGLARGAAAKRIAQVEHAVETLATATVGDLARDFAIGAVALVAEPRPLPELPTILASHPLWHAAEGELYRDALAAAGATLNLPLTHVPADRVRAEASGALACSDAALDTLLTALGKAAGPPWRRDHKDATLAALVASRPHQR